jgi:enhancing lycopene biosynthesis protein 2
LDTDTLISLIENGTTGAIKKSFDSASLISQCAISFKVYKLQKAFQKAISCFLFQYSDLDDCLKEKGKEDLRIMIKKDLEELFQIKKQLNGFSIKKEN